MFKRASKRHKDTVDSIAAIRKAWLDGEVTHIEQCIESAIKLGWFCCSVVYGSDRNQRRITEEEVSRLDTEIIPQLSSAGFLVDVIRYSTMPLYRRISIDWEQRRDDDEAWTSPPPDSGTHESIDKWLRNEIDSAHSEEVRR